MKKITNLIAIFISFVFLIALASCGKKSGVDAAIEEKVFATSATFTLTFDENENLTNGDAIPHIKFYEYDESAENHIGTYKTDTQVKFSNNVYTTSTVDFNSLTPGTKYTFSLYITFNAKEELIKTWSIETKKNGPDDIVPISSLADFKKMNDDPSANYELTSDIDCNGEKLTAIFKNTTKEKYSGIFNGNNYTIKNFKLDTSNVGLFAYTEGATIKNLKLQTTANEPTVDCSGGKSSADMGILAGNAVETVFENITIENTTILIKGNSSANLNVGIVVGKADKCSFKNVNVKNANIKYDQLRKVVNTGLFAGLVIGDSKTKEDDVAFTALECSATGSITGSLVNTTDTANVGGFIGTIGASTVVKNSYSIVDIKLNGDDSSKNASYSLIVGGFVATNDGSMKLDSCLSVADIDVKSTKNGSTALPSETELTSSYVNVAGIVGRVRSSIDSIKNCKYVEKTQAISVEAKDENNKIVVSDTIAYKYDGALIANVGDDAVLPDALKQIADSYIK